MIIIDIIKRIHHKTKRKCRRYHEIIINNDDQKEVIRIYNSFLVYNFNDGGNFRELESSSNTTEHLNCIHLFIT